MTPLARPAPQRLLWLAALCLVPVPLLLFADAFVPTMRLLELTGIIVITILVEGGHAVTFLLLGLFLAHVLGYAALLWIATRLVTTALERAWPAGLTPTVVVLIALALVVTLAFPVYDTPFHARLPHATLLEVYR